MKNRCVENTTSKIKSIDVKLNLKLNNAIWSLERTYNYENGKCHIPID